MGGREGAEVNEVALLEMERRNVGDGHHFPGGCRLACPWTHCQAARIADVGVLLERDP